MSPAEQTNKVELTHNVELERRVFIAAMCGLYELAEIWTKHVCISVGLCL